MRKKIVAGNWKMNQNFAQADELLFNIGDNMENNVPEDVELIICPPFVFLEMATDFAQNYEYKIGAQNISQHEAGAFTGEISAEMLASMDLEYCIIGHSERRKYFGETSEMLAKKVDLLLENDIEPIFCIGEQLEEREAGNHFDVIKNQIENGVFHLSIEEFANIILAYEPVWAIGTGVTASPAQAQEVHAYIRTLIVEKYGQEVADNTSILYGGSCNAKNAKELFSQQDVDGGLIGGAALKSEDFLTIAKSF